MAPDIWGQGAHEYTADTNTKLHFLRQQAAAYRMDMECAEAEAIMLDAFRVYFECSRCQDAHYCSRECQVGRSQAAVPAHCQGQIATA
jgi:hypothetical protein